jgi:transposase
MAARRKQSKKRSAANSRSRPESLVIFLDECIGGHEIARQLRARDHDVRIPNEPGGIRRGLADTDWTRQLANRDWIAVTRDKRIENRAAEILAVTQAKLALFVLRASGNLSGAEIVDMIDRAAPRMARFLAKHEPPFIAGIYRTGRVKLREKL